MFKFYVTISLCSSRILVNNLEPILITNTFETDEYSYYTITFPPYQHYVIKFVIDLRQVGGFLRVLPYPPPIKLIATI
jgi:hypothetical protein